MDQSVYTGRRGHVRTFEREGRGGETAILDDIRHEYRGQSCCYLSGIIIAIVPSDHTRAATEPSYPLHQRGEVGDRIEFRAHSSGDCESVERAIRHA